MQKQRGFTVIELLMAIVVLIGVGTIFWFQKETLTAEHRDSLRKISINSMYYNLEEVVYPSLNGYPLTLRSEALKAMDSSLMKDPDGVSIGEQSSQYRYLPADCSGDICKHYTLRSAMEREGDYEKKSSH